MKSLITKIATISFMAAMSLGTFARGEEARFDSIPDKSRVTVNGTSTLHDWSAKSSNIGGNITFKFNVAPDATPKIIREAIIANPDCAVDVTIEVKSLKSGDKGLDNKMYEALKQKNNPSITYRLTKLELAKDANADQSRFEVQTTGELTVAGTTKELQMPMVLEVVDGQHLKISGSTSMKMTTFNVKPPTAMLGTIKSGDKIKVAFEWNTVLVPVPPAK
jgi:hypothetical protein